jgi:hypothetical protein
VASDELILGEEAVEWWLFVSEVLADREERLEVISDDFQAGQSTRRAWLECRVVATE